MPTRAESSCSTREAARLLGVTVQTVQRWADAGHLACWRTVGGHRRIDRDSLNRFRLQSAAAAVTARPAAPDPAAARGLRVLITDDDPAERELLAYMVKRFDFVGGVDFASNGFEALLAIGRNRPDLLITDVVMPQLDGIGMIRTLARMRLQPDLAILAVSSHSSAEIAALGGLPTGVGFLPKPVDRVRLERYLSSLAPSTVPRAATSSGGHR